MKTLRPILDKSSYAAPIKKAIYQYFYELIFAPIFSILKEEPRHNAVAGMLLSYLREGKLTYEGNQFKGKLNATISRQLRQLGASYNKTTKSFKIEISKIPDEIKLAIIEGNQRNNEQIRRIEDFLKAVEGREIAPLKLEKFFDYPINDLQKQFDRTVSATIAIPLREDLKDKLREAYGENLNLYIKKWHDEEIYKLRKIVNQNVSQGYRASNLIDIIQHEKGVSYRKAEFLARNETSLLTAKYRQIRYEEAGIEYYKWYNCDNARTIYNFWW